MSGEGVDAAEAARLERLWAGGFGDDYIERNRGPDTRRPFWLSLLPGLACERVLEVGCETGVNLRSVAELVGRSGAYGVDVNAKALGEMRAGLPGVQALRCAARHLPFPSGSFDLVFTVGVLIHQPESALAMAMGETVRCSRRWIFCGEYFAPETLEIAYRGERAVLFKRDYGRLYGELFDGLALRQQGFVGPEADNLVFWLFEKK